VADKNLRIENLAEIAARFAPEALPKPNKPAKKKAS
jgi:hypothetical protein